MLLQLISCSDMPVPEPADIPQFISLSAETDVFQITLSAELEYETDLVSDCGFLFGADEKAMKKYPAQLIDKRLLLRISGLIDNTKYLFRAYVGNGKNVVYSDLAVAQTLPCIVEPLPEEPSDPANPDDPSGPSNPDGPSDPDEFAPYDYEIDISHLYTYWEFPGVTAVSVEDWSWITGYGPAYVYFYLGFSENTSMSSRSQVLTLTRDSRDYSVKVTQHTYLDLIDFRCPKVKEICVEKWDKNHDGEISYEEAAAATELSKAYFAGKDIDSFNEFRHFSCAKESWESLDALFAGSSLKSIVLPYTGIPLGVGMFKNCKELEFVYTHFRHVEEETFMNCVSIKEVEASIVGKRAYMGCTSLETVVQFRPCVPAMAFKGCTSLRTFEFDWYDLAFDADRVIGDEAFYGCSSLTEMDVPREITSIGARAFQGCESLSKICFSSSIPPILGEDAFANANPNLKIIVPAPLVNIYKSNWPDLAQNIMAGE